MTRTEVVVSELLTAHPVVPAVVGGPLLRALGLVERDPDYTATVAAGYLEADPDAWYTTLRLAPGWEARLQLAVCLAHVILAARAAELEAAVKAARQ